ncbi:MAG: hypothetical protein DRH93_18960 [Deltaproteobacteria bacterium]|nr:MAG: hypothetical protein DRH93_18960 [Deltaproteobacteria bacterium]
MKINAFIVTVLLILMGLPCLSDAGISSTSYAIPTSVMSGGGAPMGSASFHSNATLGQSSPPGITSSTSNDLYAGFWYTMAISNCIWDIYNDNDSDVDGLDLYHFLNPFDESDLESFTTEFGRTDCF